MQLRDPARLLREPARLVFDRLRPRLPEYERPARVARRVGPRPRLCFPARSGRRGDPGAAASSPRPERRGGVDETPADGPSPRGAAADGSSASTRRSMVTHPARGAAADGPSPRPRRCGGRSQPPPAAVPRTVSAPARGGAADDASPRPRRFRGRSQPAAVSRTVSAPARGGAADDPSPRPRRCRDPRPAGCDPPSHPTRKFIEAHRRRYMDPDSPGRAPLKPVRRGGARCERSRDCGSDDASTCRRGRCSCGPRRTGPRCLSPAGFDDAVEAPPSLWRWRRPSAPPQLVACALAAVAVHLYLCRRRLGMIQRDRERLV